MIYIIWAAPGEGKTFFLTSKALKELTKKNGKKIFSNYPIVDPKTGRSSYVWKPEYIFSTITNAMICIDEGYRDVSSRNYKDFGTDSHTFFATNRHNDDDIYIIAHNPARIDVIIREMTNVFIHVKKVSLFGRPLWFVIEGFLSEIDFTLRHSNPDVVYSRTRILFRKRTRQAYDTKFFKLDDAEPPNLELWKDDLRYKPTDPKRFILIRIIKSILGTVISTAVGIKRYLKALYKKDNLEPLQVPGTIEPGANKTDLDFSKCFGNFATAFDQSHCKVCPIAVECYHESNDHE